MKYLTKRPTLFMWVATAAMLVGKVGSHGNGFHQWWKH